MTYDGGFTEEQIRAHREAWIAALEGGEYQQTTKYLRVIETSLPPDSANAPAGVGHCCLGVMCDLVPGLQVDEVVLHGGQVVATSYDDDDVTLPYLAQAWFGVTDEDLTFDFPPGLRGQGREGESAHYPLLTETTAASLNDAGLTFAQIAQVYRHFGLNDSIDELEGAYRKDYP